MSWCVLDTANDVAFQDPTSVHIILSLKRHLRSASSQGDILL